MSGEIITWASDATGKNIHVDPLWCVYSGQTVDKALGYGWLEAIHPEDLANCRALIETEVVQGKPFHFEQRIRAADGTYRRWTVVGTPRRNDSGVLDGYVGCLVDVEPARQAEESLARSEKNFRNLFNSFQEGVSINKLIRDENGNAVDIEALIVNLGYERQTGLPLSQVVGKRASQIYPSIYSDWLPIAQQVVESGVPVTHEDYDPIAKKWMKASIFKLDETDQFGVVYYDVTAKEDEIFELQELSRRKDEFLSKLAHELRGPLDPIYNGLEIFSRKTDIDDAQDLALLGNMQREATTLVGLVDDLIDNFQIAEGKFSLVRDLVDISNSVRDAISAVQSHIENGKHDLHVKFPSSLAFVSGDPKRLTQVFTYLLKYAIKSTPDGGLIEIEVIVVDGYVIATFADNGRGMPPNASKNIFQMFSHVDGSVSLGIGLSLLSKIVKLHRGEIRAYSDGNEKGCKFFVSFPVAFGCS